MKRHPEPYVYLSIVVLLPILQFLCSGPVEAGMYAVDAEVTYKAHRLPQLTEEPVDWQLNCRDASSTRLAVSAVRGWRDLVGGQHGDDLIGNPWPSGQSRAPAFTHGHTPVLGAINVDASSNLVVHGADSNDGVDSTTLAMTVGGVPVVPTVTGSLLDYTLTYDPPANFGEGDIVTVTVDACDLVVPANCIATEVYSSTVWSLAVTDVWYGSHQVFGGIGIPQRWVNVLGNVSDPDGIASLVYSLNGGPASPLSIGPDTHRLASEGDFNVEIAYTDLISGLNQVVIAAADTLNNQTVETVTVEYAGGNVWPETYSIDWGSVTAIPNVAQVVDGLWTLEGDSIRPAILGYDRLVAIGDMTWDDYEVTVPITIHGIDPAGFDYDPGVGIIVRWDGHHDWGGSQPTIGWCPLGALGWYRWQNDLLGDRLMMIGGNDGGLIAEDESGRKLAYGVRYVFKMRVETVPGQGGLYGLKVWEDGQPEPSEWDLVAQEELSDPQNGSLVLVAHEVDASFGDVTVIPGPFPDTIPPLISGIQVAPNETSATVTWSTNEPATSSVAYGPSPAYENGSVADSALVTGHTIVLTGLVPGTLYHYQITSVDGIGNVASSKDLTFRTTGIVSSIVSDDFNADNLNTGLWEFIDPGGDATLVMTGTHTQDAWVSISVPAGTSHDVWTAGNQAPRIMQPANDTDFEIEVKFESGLSQRYQIQGVLIEEEENSNYLRFDFHSDGSSTIIFAASFTEGTPFTRIDRAITSGTPLYMRVKREGDQWTQSYSYNGENWTTGGSFSHPLLVTSVGAFVGNAGSSPPAHTGSIDYFLNTASPIVAEDGDENQIFLPLVVRGQLSSLSTHSFDAQPAAESGPLINPAAANSTDDWDQTATLRVTASGNWWDSVYHFRVPIEVNPNGYERYTKPAEAHLNFTQLLTTLGKSGTFDQNSIRVVEVNAQGAVVDESVDFQFDQDEDYDASTNAEGTLVFLLEGTTPAGVSRHFHVYFDTTDNGPFTPLTVTSQITVTDNISHEGQTSFRIQIQNATYYYHKQGAGFASMEDPDGTDWIGYHPGAGSGSAGEYRGIPNLGVFAHPGYTNSSSSLVSQGPIKAKIYSETTDETWVLIWEMYPRYAKMTLLRKPENINYWFLYEGTPNGQLDVSKDFVVRSTGVKTYVSQPWWGDIPEPEWVYFGDDDVTRVIFVAHHEDDAASDQFWQMDGNMTVFGFGREYQCCDRYLSLVPAHFTIGFAENEASASMVIDSAFRDLVVTQGQPEANNRPPVLDPIGQKTVAAEDTLSFTVSASDPECIIPSLSVENLPGGATFLDQGNGTADFVWTPIVADEGIHFTTFLASDGVLTDSETITITVQPPGSQLGNQIYLPLIIK